MTERRDPLIIDLGDTPLPPVPSPADAPPPSDVTALPAAAERALRGAAGPGLTLLGRLFWLSVVGLGGLWLVTGIESFVGGLFARSDALGWLATGLAAVVGIALAGFALRELAALARVQRVGEIRRLAAAAAEGGGAEGAAVTRALARLYRGRPEMAAALARVEDARPDTPDARALMAVAEHALLAPLDRRAEQAVSRAARRVAAVTAVVPLPVADVLAVLVANLAMIREVAEIYGGRAGVLGSWRLLRAVAAHLVATGAVAATDDILGPMLGGGVLGKLSRRFGEAAVNAALTARVGTAAIEVCRPLPFAARPRPRAASLVLDVLRGWRAPAAEGAAPPAERKPGTE